MTVRLVPLSAESFPAWCERSQAEYASDLVASGETPDEAGRRAAESMTDAFPAGTPTSDNAVFDVVDDAGENIGYLWVGRDSSRNEQSWWVWDIVVDAGQRGKGLGRETMRLAEEYALSQGASTLSHRTSSSSTLSVGTNPSLVATAMEAWCWGWMNAATVAWTNPMSWPERCDRITQLSHHSDPSFECPTEWVAYLRCKSLRAGGDPPMN